MELSEPSSGNYDEDFVKEFPYDNVPIKAKNEDLASLFYTAGYVARKARSQHCLPLQNISLLPMSSLKVYIMHVKNVIAHILLYY